MRLTPLRLVLLCAGLLSVAVFAALAAHALHLGRSDLEVAERQLSAGALAQAEGTLLRAVRAQPHDATAWRSLVLVRVGLRAQARQNESPLSEAQFVELIGKAPFEDLSARYLYHLGQKREALALLKGRDLRGRFAVARGDFAGMEGATETALAEYRSALRMAPGEETVEALFQALETYQRRSSIPDYLRQDTVMRAAPPRFRVEGHLLRGQFLDAFGPVLEMQRNSYRPTTVLVGLVSGLGWLVLLLQIGRVRTWSRAEQALIVPALLLGALSAQGTLWLVYVEEFLIGYASIQKGFVVNLLYAVLGIGLREELLKLLFFAPLIPFLIRIQEDRELRTLVLAALVGLGFAVEENLSYFGRAPNSVFVRFLTANFFHMTLTGLAGRHFIRAIRKPHSAGADLEVLGLVVLMHGVYDFLLEEKSLAELSWLSSTVYIWMAHQFLSEVLTLSGRQRRVFPLSYTFTAALMLSLGGGYFLATVRTNPLTAIGAVAGGVVGSAIIAILFFREFNEPMSRR